MNITTDSIAGGKVVFENILEEVPGGASLDVVARLDYLIHSADVDKRYLKAGAPVYFDPATRVAQVCKSASWITGGSTTAIRVGKNHHFKVDEFMNDGVTTGLISAIVTTEADYDTITVNTALLNVSGTKYGEGTVTGASTALKFSPNGLTKNDVFIGDGNADCDIVKMGTAREDALDYPINALYKISLRGGATGEGTSLITFV